MQTFSNCLGFQKYTNYKALARFMILCFFYLKTIAIFALSFFIDISFLTDRFLGSVFLFENF